MIDYNELFGLVKRYGRTTTSLQVLAPSFRHWRGHGACVAYVETFGSWVAVGAPLAPDDRQIEAMQRFAEAAREHGKRACFFGMETETPATSSFESLHIGDQPVWDPAQWAGSLSKSVKEQLRRARKKNVVVREASAPELMDPEHPTRRGIDRVLAQWLESRRVAPMGFMLELNPYQEVQERRVFLAEQEGAVVGVMVASPIYHNKGWLLDSMLRDPSAPNGTIELLIDCAMRAFAAEQCSYVTLGLSPFVGVSSRFVALIRDAMGHFYNFKGLYAFKTKLRPVRWEPVYIAHPKTQHALGALFDLMSAFLPGGWLRFAGRTLIQRARAEAATLAMLLVPWIALLAFANTQHWFPSTQVKVGWIAADLAIGGALVTLARTWRRGVALGACTLSLLAAVLGIAQIALYNASHAHGAEWLWLGLGIAAPLWTSGFLWASRDRAQRYLDWYLQPAQRQTPRLVPTQLAEPRVSAGITAHEQG